eukprot:scaffold52957_cov48-Phaeocystis_antarctica.AAC.2
MLQAYNPTIICAAGLHLRGDVAVHAADAQLLRRAHALHPCDAASARAAPPPAAAARLGRRRLLRDSRAPAVARTAAPRLRPLRHRRPLLPLRRRPAAEPYAYPYP